MSIGSFYAEHFQLQDDDVISALSAASTARHLRPGEVLVRQGEVQREIPFLVNGIIRGFYFDINGQEITDCLVTKTGMPAVAGADFEKPAPVYLDALAESDLLVISAEDVYRLLEQFPMLIQLYNRILVSAFDIHWEIKTTLCRSTAIERYQWFLEYYPGVADQISSKCIASFLGMTPVTLSRLRRTIREENQGADCQAQTEE